MKWLLAGTASFCTCTVVAAWALGAAWTAILLLGTITVVVIRGGSAWLDHAEMRARIDHENRYGRTVGPTVRDTTSRPV